MYKSSQYCVFKVSDGTLMVLSETKFIYHVIYMAFQSSLKNTIMVKKHNITKNHAQNDNSIVLTCYFLCFCVC